MRRRAILRNSNGCGQGCTHSTTRNAASIPRQGSRCCGRSTPIHRRVHGPAHAYAAACSEFPFLDAQCAVPRCAPPIGGWDSSYRKCECSVVTCGSPELLTSDVFRRGYVPRGDELLVNPFSTAAVPGSRFKVQYEYAYGLLKRVRDFNTPATIYWVRIPAMPGHHSDRCRSRIPIDAGRGDAVKELSSRRDAFVNGLWTLTTPDSGVPSRASCASSHP